MALNVIKISIRDLVEFFLRSGDIDHRFVGMNRAIEGTKYHQKVQKAGGENYLAEVQLKYEILNTNFLFTLKGRADGIIIEKDKNVLIDEIKTTHVPLEYINENYNLLHWAQAKCYAFIYGEQNDLGYLDVQITYYNIDSDEMKKIKRTFSINELKEFFYGLIEKYLVWEKHIQEWNTERDLTIKSMIFPFETYRIGQRELAVSVYRTITGNKKLFVQAPTGIGKTISTLFPAIKAIAEKKTTKIFYLTAKTITRQVAEESINKMRECGLLFKSIILTAKDKICFKETSICNPEYCEYAKGHFDRVDDAIVDITTNEKAFTREVIEKYSRKHIVCPFELSLDLAISADCVICDYNYVFDPRVYLRRFFQFNDGDYTFLIDEAHNLVDRSREMFSAEMLKSSFLTLKKIYKPKGNNLYKVLSELNTYMLDMKKKCDQENYYINTNQPDEIYPLLRKLIKESEPLLSEKSKSDVNDELLKLYFDTLNFLKISELYDDKYITYVEKSHSDVKLKLFCLDPSYLLSEAVKRGKSSIYFSATLNPLNYFCEILGGDESDYKITLKSPFKTSNLCLLIADSISTKFKNRENSYNQIAQYIHSIIIQKKGNYLSFFPSYKYMNEVFNSFSALYPDIMTIVQVNIMSEEEREEFLNRFKLCSNELLVGFTVLGGIFSEGIDLKGDRLLGAIIVSVGLPQICLERNIIMNYFKGKKGLGFEYAYMYPGMNKVLQASGRVIRSENDKGVVLLIDERFCNYSYKKLFPSHWKYYEEVRSLMKMNTVIKNFWSKN